MMRRSVLICLAMLAVAGPVPGALADGDPGSDVLLYQPLFLEADSGISISQQAQLGALLAAAGKARFPIRVAIVASRFDLGAVTGLWDKPQAYARFLGLELSQTYNGRLLVVMPDGFGFNWPGHASAAAYRSLARIPVSGGAAGLSGATLRGVRSLASAAGIRLSPPAAGAGTQPPQSGSGPSGPAPSGSGADNLVGIVAAALAAAIGLGLLARRLGWPGGSRRWRLPRRAGRPRPRWQRPRRAGRPRPTLIALTSGVGLAAGAAIALLVVLAPSNSAQSDPLARNPELDPGTAISGPAPDFTLTDQFGRAVSLHSFRGRVVLLAFNDSECTTICPLTTTAMLEAKAMLGAAGRRVQLLGIDANPKATSLQDVLSYSQLHGMVHSWHFLTGSLPQLKLVWKAYGIQAAIEAGQIAHTPALFVIDARGRLSRLFLTQQSYAAVGQLGQLLARAASNLLPGHPAVHEQYAYSKITGIGPASAVSLPLAGGGSTTLKPGRPRVLVFFATWDRQVTGLASGLEGLGGYASRARGLGLPGLTAVDEGSVEPAGALRSFLRGMRPLGYPVAVDRAGRVGDGYEVQGLPWLMVVSAAGRIAWYYSVAALGWPSTAELMARVRQALSQVAGPPTSLRATLAQLTGSPAPLAALHQQADQLLGGLPSLTARIRSLRGYPLVINAWASWCGPCRSEFGLFAAASARYGRRVAFLGVDTGDSSSDARLFLSQHPISYPSYQASTSGADSLVPQGLAGLPTTIFLNRQGKPVYVHTGQYQSQGTLDADIQAYALGH